MKIFKFVARVTNFNIFIKNLVVLSETHRLRNAGLNPPFRASHQRPLEGVSRFKLSLI